MSTCLVCSRPLTAPEIQRGETGCKACLQFFRRALENDKWEEYVCENQNNCLKEPSIDGTACRLCRFVKCVKSRISDFQLGDLPPFSVFEASLTQK
uniref:Nuclear receptor domain-containing protein n=1 Tax=Panagrolaimus davidi TaxID=227884 RepID=A0A914QH93_9BILA